MNTLRLWQPGHLGHAQLVAFVPPTSGFPHEHEDCHCLFCPEFRHRIGQKQLCLPVNEGCLFEKCLSRPSPAITSKTTAVAGESKQTVAEGKGSNMHQIIVSKTQIKSLITNSDRTLRSVSLARRFDERRFAADMIFFLHILCHKSKYRHRPSSQQSSTSQPWSNTHDDAQRKESQSEPSHHDGTRNPPWGQNFFQLHRTHRQVAAKRDMIRFHVTRAFALPSQLVP